MCPIYLGACIRSIHSVNQEPASSTATQYLRRYYLIALGFLITRIGGFSLMALWLLQCGPEVEELLLPTEPEEIDARD